MCVSSKQELLNCFVYNVDVVGLLGCSPRLDQATGHTFCLLVLKLCLDTKISLFFISNWPHGHLVRAHVPCPLDFEVKSKADTPSQRETKIKPTCMWVHVLYMEDVIPTH